MMKTYKPITQFKKKIIWKTQLQYFCGGLVVRILGFHCGDPGSVLGQEKFCKASGAAKK